MVPSALYLLRRNIAELLRTRKESQHSLAFSLGHDKSWLNKFLNGEREIQLRDLDKVADFFGLSPYQLFQPGITAFTERRLGTERRTGRDRRVGHAARQALRVDSDVQRAHPRRKGEAYALSSNEMALIDHARELAPADFEAFMQVLGAKHKRLHKKA